MAAAIGVAALVLIGVLFAVRIGANDDSRRTVSVDDVFSTSAPSNTGPPASSATTAPTVTSAPRPSGSAPAPTRSDLTITHKDSTGRFTVTLPRTWEYSPSEDDTEAQWSVKATDSAGRLMDTGVEFQVQWVEQGWTLEQCADELDRSLRQNSPTAAFTRQEATVNGMRSLRIDGVGTAQHLTAWVLTKGERCWVPQFVSPIGVYDGAESIVLAVMDTFVTE